MDPSFKASKDKQVLKLKRRRHEIIEGDNTRNGKKNTKNEAFKQYDKTEEETNSGMKQNKSSELYELRRKLKAKADPEDKLLEFKEQLDQKTEKS